MVPNDVHCQCLGVNILTRRMSDVFTLVWFLQHEKRDLTYFYDTDIKRSYGHKWKEKLEPTLTIMAIM